MAFRSKTAKCEFFVFRFYVELLGLDITALIFWLLLDQAKSDIFNLYLHVNQKTMEILIDLENCISENKLGICILSKEEKDTIFLKILEFYKFEFNKLFIWDGIEGEIIPYEERDWFEIIFEVTSVFENEIYICITNEDYFPWEILKGKKKDILRLLNDFYYFEYFLFDGGFNRVVFDTHHNIIKIVELNKL